MNIKVLHWELYENNKEKHPSYNIKNTEETLQVEYFVPYNGAYRSGSFEIDLTKKEKVYDIFIYEMNDYVTEIVEAFKYCNRNGFTTNYADRKKVARVVVDNRGNVFVVLIFACKDIEGYRNIIMNQRDFPASHYVRELCPWFTELQEKASVKRRMIKHMDVYKTVAYLEAQVDLLTRIVLERGTPEIVAALEEADKESVLDIKDIEAVRKEFTESKHMVREHQKEYYREIRKT